MANTVAGAQQREAAGRRIVDLGFAYPDALDLRLECVPGGRFAEVFRDGGGVLRGLVVTVRPGSALVLRVPIASGWGEVSLRIDGGVHLEAHPDALRERWHQR